LCKWTSFWVEHWALRSLRLGIIAIGKEARYHNYDGGFPRVFEDAIRLKLIDIEELNRHTQGRSAFLGAHTSHSSPGRITDSDSLLSK